MPLHAILFYLFSAVLLLSAGAVVTARNPVHAVLFLILAFFNAAGLFLLIGAEFVAFILVIVYVGAVAVLFLFVVMMLDVDFRELRKDVRRYLPIALASGALLAAELGAAVWNWKMEPDASVANPITNMAGVENTRALGRVLYTDFAFPFQISGLILLVAMIGAIVLTHRTRRDVRRQRASQQVDRPMSDIIEVVKVQSGKGVL